VRWGGVVGVATGVCLLAACSQGPCDFHSHGACVEFTYDTTATPDVQARVDRLLELEMAFWGLHHLGGWKVQFRGTPEYLCYVSARNDGCTNYFNREISVRVLPDSEGCFESSELLHELGHYTLGDPAHSDPRWRDVDGQFAGIVWQRDDAAESCRHRYRDIFVGMWPVRIDGF